jgi:hypothetical protein
MPQFLAAAFQPAPHEIERCGPLEITRGEPIAVRGWARDPTTGRGGRTFVAWDAHWPMPIASGIARNDQPNGDDIGFSGIADTTDLQPGVHVLRVLLLNQQSACWYPLGRYEIDIQAPLYRV